MNPVSFTNVGAGIPEPAPPTAHGQMAAMNKPENNIQSLGRRVALSLQSQGLFTGWRAKLVLSNVRWKWSKWMPFRPLPPSSVLLLFLISPRGEAWCYVFWGGGVLFAKIFRGAGKNTSHGVIDQLMAANFDRITLRRLINPASDINVFMQAAITFEQRAFQKGTTKVGLKSLSTRLGEPFQFLLSWFSIRPANLSFLFCFPFWVHSIK